MFNIETRIEPSENEFESYQKSSWNITRCFALQYRYVEIDFHRESSGEEMRNVHGMSMNRWLWPWRCVPHCRRLTLETLSTIYLQAATHSLFFFILVRQASDKLVQRVRVNWGKAGKMKLKSYLTQNLKRVDTMHRGSEIYWTTSRGAIR